MLSVFSSSGRHLFKTASEALGRHTDNGKPSTSSPDFTHEKFQRPSDTIVSGIIGSTSTAAAEPEAPAEKGSSLWLEAYRDPVAGLKAFTSCVHTCNLLGDDEWRLVVANRGKMLKVTSAQGYIAALPIPIPCPHTNLSLNLPAAPAHGTKWNSNLRLSSVSSSPTTEIPVYRRGKGRKWHQSRRC